MVDLLLVIFRHSFRQYESLNVLQKFTTLEFLDYLSSRSLLNVTININCGQNI